jgi:hypothetical protein
MTAAQVFFSEANFVVLRCTSLYCFNSHSRSSTTELSASELHSLISHFARTPQKTVCIVDKACLPRRCLEMDLHVTILK